VGPVGGVAIFGLDALSSAAYGPEAVLTILIPLGTVGLGYIVPISASIIVLLTIVYFSYRQTIAAYPAGGGSYTVANQNLGAKAGLLAAAALMIDYILTVAVGISACVGALVSAMPKLQPYTVSTCLGILVLLTLVNLRGLREASFVFMVPPTPISVSSNHGEQQVMGNTFAQLIRHSYVRSGRPSLLCRFWPALLQLLIPQSANASSQSLAPETLET